ncbi:hypothetical protein PAXINDRAFT_157256 [Paxillus involutus ATCC 200175]|uniref:DUF6589 domain-containing protein n=1 Tax=Paxillus involutus ATCC 200175 TaxID=664439 RepID=A0A0C9TLW6_PAXIN|nr:hypothetical protein PAXINDRAFT_157256 [Paxillus involutus ATCC 200175]
MIPSDNTEIAIIKIDDILRTIQDANWTLNKFLFHLFALEDAQGQELKRGKQHQQMLVALLNGSAKPAIARDPQNWMGRFMSGVPVKEINHTRPALITWAVNEVTALVQKEASIMGGKDGGLQICARKAPATTKRNHGPSITWEAINSFSFASLQALAEQNAPITWHLISSYWIPEFETSTLVVPTALQFLPIYTMVIHLGHSLSCASTYAAPETMSSEKQDKLKTAAHPNSEWHFWVVGDNVQTYTKMYEPRILIMSGDGKTFDQLLWLKRYLIVHEGDLESLWCLMPMLELWHTKWTELSRLVRHHWGGENFMHNTTTLGCMANHASCPTPANLRKVDFYNGAHLVNLVLNANLLNCWEPTSVHRTLLTYDPDHPDRVPRGTPWPQMNSTMSDTSPQHDEEPVMEVDDDSLADPDTFSVRSADDDTERDEALANSTLFVCSAIWWCEVCRAIAVGDLGRVWEILKLWIFTFAGGGNPNYTQYLLKLYCNIRWEFLSLLKTAILNNWLVNPHSVIELFIELDLLQEHSNFWLEAMAQHKGKEFNEPAYRKVLAPNVTLKDTYEPCNKLCKVDINRCHPGRDLGFKVKDNFESGDDIIDELGNNAVEKDIDSVPDREDLQAPVSPMFIAGGYLRTTDHAQQAQGVSVEDDTDVVESGLDKNLKRHACGP